MNRRTLLAAAPALLLAGGARSFAAPGARRVMLMNRIGPTSSDLFIANADGANERPLLQTPGFDFHAAFSADGREIVFTSERRGRGQADLYLATAAGENIRPLLTDAAIEDAAVFSPDRARIAFVSTRGDRRANIFVLDRARGRLRNLTGRRGIESRPGAPGGFYRPAWSPDGRWLAFSSDRFTPWRGHACTTPGSTSCVGSGEGWEHVQALSIYVIGADGGGFRQVAARPGFSCGSPKWSPDSKRIVFYEMAVEDTWNSRIAFLVNQAASQIVSVDVATGARIEHTTGPGLKLFPQFLNAREIGYLRKGGDAEGLDYTSDRPKVKVAARAPVWSPDGAQVIYQKLGFKPLAQNTPLHSWDRSVDAAYTDTFPRLSSKGELVVTEQAANSSIAVMNADGTNRRRVFDTKNEGRAVGACWSPDGMWIVFGFGPYFEARFRAPARLMRVRPDGTGLETLFEAPQHAAFPSVAPDGRRIVFRLTDQNGGGGLRILDLASRTISVLTNAYDTMPDWSPDGRRIAFTRKLADGNFDIFTIRPDGGGLTRLTTTGANDAHAVWTADGRLLWNSGYNGFKDEAPLYDFNFQPYGQIWIMNADGGGKRALTDSLWEDSQAVFVR